MTTVILTKRCISNMIEVTNKYGSMMAFDGRVIELFESPELKGCHIKQVSKIELKEKRNGIVEIWCTAYNTGDILMLLNIEGEQITMAQSLVEQIRSQMSGTNY